MTENNTSLSEIDRMSILPYGGTMTLKSVNLLVSDSSVPVIDGDVNADEKFNIADAVMMQKYLLDEGTLTNWKAGDLYKDDCINIFDFCIMKKMLAQKNG